MNKTEFYDLLDKGDIEVTFTKKTDGTTRVMRCSSNIPEDKKKGAKLEAPQRPDGVVTVYDTDAKNWRSFYADNIIEVKPLNTRFGLIQE